MTRQSPTRDSPDLSRVTKLARRPHRKSRNGCFNCKRRKVKCDEVKPACANCIRFGIPCDFAPPPSPSNVVTPPGAEVGVSHGGEPSIPRRGPGRPRKDWAALTRRSPQLAETATSPPSTAVTPVPSSASSIIDSIPCSINVADAELLLHFVSSTAATLTDSEDSDDGGIRQFWERNVPQIGISYHFVLHLIYALAGYHLAFLDVGSGDRPQQFSLAEHHSAIGLAELNKVLPSLDETNCGALYVSAVLVCYCTFAAGPTSMNDLLVCDVSDGAPQRWLPLIHGVRLIRQTIEPATLFTGLMAPLGNSMRIQPQDPRPSYLRDGFSRVQWIEPLDELRKWIASHESPETIVYSRSLDSLCEIYEATYGDLNGIYSGPPSNQFIFGWLYRMQDPFVACLRRKEPLALLILAYYAPLLRTLKKCWFLEGWTEHLLHAIGELLSPDLGGWLQWPLEISQHSDM
ncbi:Fc.00g014310.m01.CDS01 [Cosmosporella sp. VM-42]